MTQYTANDFVHLHLHTEYSLLDGQSQIPKVINRAKEIGSASAAITDHGVMFGVIDFHDEAIKQGIKPILGMEAYLSRRTMYDKDPEQDKRPFHLLLLAKNMQGYLNLMKLASEAQLHGYYYRPRIDRDLLAAHSEGIIATSGCLAAEVPRLIGAGKYDEAEKKIGWYQDVFGAENFYLEIQPHDIKELHALNKWLIDYRNRNHTPVQLLATNDVHYVNLSDVDSHDTLLCIQTAALKRETNRMKLEPMGSYYMKSAQDMRGELNSLPEAMLNEAMWNSLKIADMCNVDLKDKRYHIPKYKLPAEYENLKEASKAYLRYLVETGMDWRYPSGWRDDNILTNRIDYELDIINTMGFNNYFLIVWDLCQYALHKNIWWNVRGSGAGSLIAYSLGITSVDPIQNNLFFERFLNPGRISMPDIDIDYQDDQRDKMIAYAVRRYGKDHVAAIITFGTMAAKGAIKDVGRALGVDLNKVNYISAHIPQEAKPRRIREYIEMSPELTDLKNRDAESRLLFEQAEMLQGITRHASTHAAGIIIGDEPLVQYAPLHRITGTDPSGGALEAVLQFPMETAEHIGLLKVDFLGLSTLTVMRRACDLIEKHHNVKYTLNNIPYRHDDPSLSDADLQMLDEAFRLIARGETVGVFQLESTGMQAMLRGMQPFKFDHIVAGVALYRPGPMDFIPQYNARMHGAEEITYLHPKLEPILAETYGIMVYQENLMQIARDLFGYELAKADDMRKAVSKKRDDDLKKHRQIFRDNGPKNGVDVETSDKIFDMIDFFANYGFNKAHATDYAMVAVKTAFLKTHYPHEFMAALLSVHLNSIDKIAVYLEDCRRMRIRVMPPDINQSEMDFDIQSDKNERIIRFGMAAIKNASSQAIKQIIDERQNKKGFYKSLTDLCNRINLRSDVGKRSLESLIKSGAMDSMGDRDDMLFNLGEIVNRSNKESQARMSGQLNLFDFAGQSKLQEIKLKSSPEKTTVNERLAWEKELMGIYISGRPVDQYRSKIRHFDTLPVSELNNSESEDVKMMNGTNITIAGQINRVKEIITKKGDRMAFVDIEDWYDTGGIICTVFFPKTYEALKQESDAIFDEGRVVIINGRFDLSRDVPQIIVNNLMWDLDNPMNDWR